MKLILSVFLSVLITEAFSQNNCNEANSLVSVRKRKTGNTEYVIFNLKKPVTAATDMSNAQPPFTADGSGNNVQVTGCKYKKVKFSNIVWTCSIVNNFSNTTLVRQVKSIGQLEGQIEYIIGYKCNVNSVVSYSYDDADLTKFVVRFKR